MPTVVAAGGGCAGGRDAPESGMITRHHQKGDTASSAVYSDCERYRYLLTRIWQPEGARLLYVLLNPSTATEAQNDPTVERCERRARVLGFGGFRVTNIFAFRATDPKEMRAAADPVGQGNDAAIGASLDWVAGTGGRVICAWGAHGAHLGRGAEVEAVLRASGRELFHLGLTKAGAPRHPLYIGYDRQPQPWQRNQG